MRKIMLLALAVLLIAGATALPGRAQRREIAWKQYAANPFVFKLAQPRPDERTGSIMAADVNNDGLLDYLYTTPGSVGAYDHSGKVLWVEEVGIHLTGQSESEGLPGLHAPGVQVADVDGDRRAEVLFLKTDDSLAVLDGATSREKRTASFPVPQGALRWEHLVVCNLRGKGDRDLVLQATNARGYRVGHYVTAYALDRLEGAALWQERGFGALAHGPLRVADLTGDGRDEVCGFTLLGPDGRPTSWRYPPISPQFAGGASFHIDSLFIADVRPDIPGLEVVLLEEGRNHVGVANFERGLLWWKHFDRQEPQNAAVGEFSLNHPGLEVWCRSRYDTHQKPWVFDALGSVVASYELSKIAPADWTIKGAEEIWTVDWTGDRKQLAAAKERHEEGDVCIFDPMTGKFFERFKEQAARLYVADVSGDWREELVVVNDTEVRVYWNPKPNPDPKRTRLWRQDHYRRNKMTWNYYSP